MDIQVGVFSPKNVDRRSSSLEAVLSLDDEEFDGEADKSMAFGGLWTGVTEDLLTGTVWWFQFFLIFTPSWGRFPFWLIFFKGVETTN